MLVVSRVQVIADVAQHADRGVVSSILRQVLCALCRACGCAKRVYKVIAGLDQVFEHFLPFEGYRIFWRGQGSLGQHGFEIDAECAGGEALHDIGDGMALQFSGPVRQPGTVAGAVQQVCIKLAGCLLGG